MYKEIQKWVRICSFQFEHTNINIVFHRDTYYFWHNYVSRSFFIQVTCSCNNVSQSLTKKWFYSGVRVFISSLMSLAMDLKKKQTNYFHFWQSIRNQRREFAKYFHSPNISFHDAVLSSESLQETLIPFFVLLNQKQRNLLPF